MAVVFDWSWSDSGNAERMEADNQRLKAQSGAFVKRCIY